ncbi:MAG TPA: hypothetical protein EYN07_10680 [Flavobacteriaceae bacterium]|nr:hypothetical protein [Flavobacteriaceae bacterium]HIN99693.1 hypothetical protein [Flavobacteriaceae bacterium]
MKVGIISGRYPRTNFDSYVNHKVYADLYGYTYIHCNWPTKHKNKYLNKIEYILYAFSFFDYIVWIDDDAFFYDFSKDVFQYSPQGEQFLSACESPTFKELKTYFSSGQFVLRCTPLAKQFLLDILKTDIALVKSWWPKEMGYYTGGDQDIMIYLFHEKIEYKKGLQLYEYKCFNSRAANLFDTDVHKPLILHFTGKPDIKNYDYKQVQIEKGLDSSLVPKEILSEYNLVKQKEEKGFWFKILKRLRLCF